MVIEDKEDGIADGNEGMNYEEEYAYSNGHKNGMYYRISPISLAVFFFLAIFIVAEWVLLYSSFSLLIPDVMVSLVPYTFLLVIPGMSEVMSRLLMMVISSALILANAGLHLYDSKRNLKASFGITFAMIAGLGLNIGLESPAFVGYDMLYYAVFAAVGIAFVIDFICILEYPENMDLALEGEQAVVHALKEEKELAMEEVKMKEEELSSEEEQLKLKGDELSGIQTELSDQLAELEEETELLKTKEEEVDAMQAKLEERLAALSEEEEVIKLHEQELAETKAKLEEMRAELEEEEEIMKAKGEELESVMMEKFEDRMKELEEEEERLKMKEQEIEETIKHQLESKLADVEAEEEQLKLKSDELEKEKAAVHEEMDKLRAKSDELSALEAKLRNIDLLISKELARLEELQTTLSEKESELSEDYLRMIATVLPKVRRLADRAEYVASVLDEKSCALTKEKLELIRVSEFPTVTIDVPDMHVIDIAALELPSKRPEGALAGVLAGKAAELNRKLEGDKISVMPDEDSIYKEGSVRDELICFKKDVEDVRLALTCELEEDKWRKLEEALRNREKNHIILESASLDEDSVTVYGTLASASDSMLDYSSERARRIVEMIENDAMLPARAEKVMHLAPERACSICFATHPAESEWCPHCGVKVIYEGAN